jgi:cellulose synthase/poly-beta-1,6-N-acetylglucosamine synthase-like glycosyltransferase
MDLILTPEVSVIIPARNEEACLAACLRTLVGQSGASYEVIVVDDHSTDRTREIGESFVAPTLSQKTRKDGAPAESFSAPLSQPMRKDEAPDVSVTTLSQTIRKDGAPELSPGLSPKSGDKGGAPPYKDGSPVVRVITADQLPQGWSGKCNAAWSGAKIAKGKWLLFTDADTKHAPDSIAGGLREALEHSADLLSYSPRQEVQGLAERALMPVIFAELAKTYPPKAVCDPKSPVAAANGQYLLIRRDVYDAVGGHAAVAKTILEDVELARLVKRAGYRLRFRMSDAVSTRMYRSFPQMLEGWTKNLTLLFPHAPSLALLRSIEFVLIAGGALAALTAWLERKSLLAAVAAAIASGFWLFFVRRIRRAHFDWLSNALAVFGLPFFAVLLLNSDISHRQGSVRWKGREYAGVNNMQPQLDSELVCRPYGTQAEKPGPTQP